MQYPKRPAPLKVTISRQLRQDATSAEKAVWQLVRNRRLLGLKFRRQHVIDGFITDFYCPALRLVLEIDGSIHDGGDQRARDGARTEHFVRAGRRVARIQNDHVCESTLVAAIKAVLTPAELLGKQIKPLSTQWRGVGVRRLGLGRGYDTRLVFRFMKSIRINCPSVIVLVK